MSSPLPSRPENRLGITKQRSRRTIHQLTTSDASSLTRSSRCHPSSESTVSDVIVVFWKQNQQLSTVVIGQIILTMNLPIFRPTSLSIDKDTPLPDDFEPGAYDVIVNRGKHSYNHIGNRRYRLTIEMNTDRYSKAATKLDKSIVVNEIVDTFRSGSGGGGFVKKTQDGQWVEIGDQLAREKVGHALRDSIQARQRRRAGSKTILQVIGATPARSSSQATTSPERKPRASKTASLQPQEQPELQEQHNHQQWGGGRQIMPSALISSTRDIQRIQLSPRHQVAELSFGFQTDDAYNNDNNNSNKSSNNDDKDHFDFGSVAGKSTIEFSDIPFPNPILSSERITPLQQTAC